MIDSYYKNAVFKIEIKQKLTLMFITILIYQFVFQDLACQVFLSMHLEALLLERPIVSHVLSVYCKYLDRVQS